MTRDQYSRKRKRIEARLVAAQRRMDNDFMIPRIQTELNRLDDEFRVHRDGCRKAAKMRCWVLRDLLLELNGAPSQSLIEAQDLARGLVELWPDACRVHQISIKELTKAIKSRGVVAIRRWGPLTKRVSATYTDGDWWRIAEWDPVRRRFVCAGGVPGTEQATAEELEQARGDVGWGPASAGRSNVIFLAMSRQ